MTGQEDSRQKVPFSAMHYKNDQKVKNKCYICMETKKKKDYKTRQVISVHLSTYLHVGKVHPIEVAQHLVDLRSVL